MNTIAINSHELWSKERLVDKNTPSQRYLGHSSKVPTHGEGTGSDSL